MDRNKRQKASDVFNQGESIMGPKVPLKEAFPTIDKLRVEVTESGRGVSPMFRGEPAVYDHVASTSIAATHSVITAVLTSDALFTAW